MKNLFVLILGFAIASCTTQSSISNRYLSAEELWTEKNYKAAVIEFDEIVKENPNSSVGLQALWRASETRTLFLEQHQAALQGFEAFVERASQSELVPRAKKEIAEIYFSRLRQFKKSTELYRELLKSDAYSSEEKALFEYRIARAYFLSDQFRAATEKYEHLLEKNILSNELRLKAKQDLAYTWYALGDLEKKAYEKALALFIDLQKELKGKRESLYAEARFGEAAAREEMDQLEEAFKIYSEIVEIHPAPNVVKVRMIRLEERLKKKRK